jgi:hypothetical protein
MKAQPELQSGGFIALSYILSLENYHRLKKNVNNSSLP